MHGNFDGSYHQRASSKSMVRCAPFLPFRFVQRTGGWSGNYLVRVAGVVATFLFGGATRVSRLLLTNLTMAAARLAVTLFVKSRGFAPIL